MPPPYPARQIGILFQRDDRDLTDRYGLMVAPFFRIEISDQNERVLFSAESLSTEGGYDLNGLIVSDIDWEENDCQASMMTFTVNNVDMTLHDSRMFAEGNSIDLWMGYDGRTPDYMGRAIIVEPAPDFPGDTIPTLKITAYDISYFMMEEGKAEVQAEGTEWWERHRINQPSANPRGASVELDTIPDDEQERVGRSSEMPTHSQSIDTLNPGTNVQETRVNPVSVTGNAPQSPTPRSRTPLRRASLPRRRQERGKVWRNLRDDEIAAEIFRSYGVVPYTEALDQNARARRETHTVQNTSGGDLDSIWDTERDRLRGEAEAQAQAQRDQHRSAPSPNSQHSIDRDGATLDPPVQSRPIYMTRVDEATVSITVEVGGRRVVQKAGTSDWEFLKKLAKAHGFIVFVFYHYDTHEWIGYWGSPLQVPQNVTYQFHYNRGNDTTVSSFKPKASMRGQSTEIDLIYVDPIMRKEQRLRVAMENVSAYSPEFRGPDASSQIEEPLGSGPEVVLMIHGQRVSVQANHRFTSVDDARRWLMAFWYQHASEFCESEGQFIIGIPEIHCRHKHNLHGYGRYDGQYFMTQVTHSMKCGSGYSTTFSAFRMSDMLMSPPDQETDALTVESNDLGELVPAAQDAVNEWRRS